MKHYTRTCTLLLVAILSFDFSHAFGQEMRVRELSGTSRAFLLIRDGEGKILGRGEFSQTARGSQVTSTLSLHFRDGSLDEETTRYSQGRLLRLISDHHVQRGPFFPKATDMTVNANGHVSLTIVDDGKGKTEDADAKLTPETINGLIGPVLLNWPKGTAEQKFDFVAPVGKGRVIQLKITTERRDKFAIADTTAAAQVYRIHYELGGLTGVIAPMIGKQPDDAFVWLTSGVPSLVREQGALYAGGPILSLELAGTKFGPMAAAEGKQN